MILLTCVALVFYCAPTCSMDVVFYSRLTLRSISRSRWLSEWFRYKRFRKLSSSKCFRRIEIELRDFQPRRKRAQSVMMSHFSGCWLPSFSSLAAPSRLFFRAHVAATACPQQPPASLKNSQQAMQMRARRKLNSTQTRAHGNSIKRACRPQRAHRQVHHRAHR